MSSLDWQAAAQRRMRRLVIALVALVVLLVVIVVVLALRAGSTGPAAGGSSSPAGSATSTVSAAAPSPTPTFTPDSSFVAPIRWVQLPRPSSSKMGLPVGYAHTPQGAVAAAVSVAEHGRTWDLDGADRTVQVYTDPARLANVRADARTWTMDYREKYGLPRTGPLPAGASLSCSPIGVSWAVADSNTVQVSILSRIVYTIPGQDTQTVLNSTQLRMIWTGGDWHNTPYNAGQAAPALEPTDYGSSAFNDEGWTAIQEGSGMG